MLISFKHPHYTQEIWEAFGFHLFWVQFLIELVEVILFFSQEFHFWIFFKQVTFLIFLDGLSRIHDRRHQEYLLFLTDFVDLIKFIGIETGGLADQVL